MLETLLGSASSFFPVTDWNNLRHNSVLLSDNVIKFSFFNFGSSNKFSDRRILLAILWICSIWVDIVFQLRKNARLDNHIPRSNVQLNKRYVLDQRLRLQHVLVIGWHIIFCWLLALAERV